MVDADYNFLSITWSIDCFDSGFCTGSVYLCDFLMKKKKQNKIRIPVPQKPPKAEDSRKNL